MTPKNNILHFAFCTKKGEAKNLTFIYCQHIHQEKRHINQRRREQAPALLYIHQIKRARQIIICIFNDKRRGLVTSPYCFYTLFVIYMYINLVKWNFNSVFVECLFYIFNRIEINIPIIRVFTPDTNCIFICTFTVC